MTITQLNLLGGLVFTVG